jgi:hypothetical protein
VAAVLIAVIVSSTPPSSVRAALPDLAGPAPASAIPRDGTTSAPAALPLPARAAVMLEAVALDSQEFASLPTVPSDARALDTLARVPEPTPAAPTPAALAPAALAAPPAPSRSAPRAVVRAAERPARLWAQLRDGLTVSGVATWYPGTRGYARISHVAMPGARYLTRGRTAPRALICAGHRCTVVRVVDACACSVGTRRARVVDLSATALMRLGLDHRRGVYQVRVTLLAP